MHLHSTLNQSVNDDSVHSSWTETCYVCCQTHTTAARNYTTCTTWHRRPVGTPTLWQLVLPPDVTGTALTARLTWSEQAAEQVLRYFGHYACRSQARNKDDLMSVLNQKTEASKLCTQCCRLRSENNRGRMHDTVASTSPRLKSTYAWLATKPACMTQIKR